MNNLIDNLIKDGWLKTPMIIEAFRKIKRVDFMPQDSRNLAELNEALPIGYGQTISQPLTVAFMLELLQPRPGDKILDVGSGSGWTSTLLAYIVSQKGNPKSQIPNPKQIPWTPAGGLPGGLHPNDQNSKGRVIAIEIVPELMKFCKKNVAKYNFIEKGIAEIICADGSKGYKKEAPFDKILVSAAVHPHTKNFGVGVQQQEIPDAWRKQLKIGGRIVTPVGSSIWLLEKTDKKEFKEKEYPGFVFVPLVQK